MMSARAALILAMATATADAQPGLAWQAPASCPDLADVRARIERRLGDGHAIGGVVVDVSAGDRGYVASVVSDGEHRTIASASCDELADAVAVIVARGARAMPSPAVVVAAPPAPAPVTTPTTHDWDGGARLLALSGIGVLPHVGIGGELGAFVRYRSATAELGYARWATGVTSVQNQMVQEVDIGLSLVTARIGWRPEPLPLKVYVGGELGSMRGIGVAPDRTRGGSARWRALTAGVGVGAKISHWIRLVGTIDLVTCLDEIRFQLSSGETIFEAGRVSVRASFGIEVGRK
jgi:hypothetical protein